MDLIIWSLRGLSFCLISQSLGPKTLMINQMVTYYFYFIQARLRFLILIINL